MNIRRPLLTLAVLAGLAPLAAHAEEDILTYQVLNCEKECLPHNSAMVISTPLPEYPMRYRGSEGPYVEALVDVDFTIALDGSVKNTIVENLLGPQEFADNALRAVSLRHYQPATEGGKPVEENHRVRFMFEVHSANRGARRDVVDGYARAMRLAGDNKPADALAELDAIAARPQLNLYERTMVAYAQALLDGQSGDYRSGRDAIRIATILTGQFLDSRSLGDAFRLRIRLEALTGEFAEAFTWFGILRDKGLTRPDDPEGKLVDKLHALIAAPEPLAMDGNIPAAGTPVFWQHTLLRRSFEFHQVVGKLERFELHCQRHNMIAPIDQASNWTVPASWSGCFVNVQGAPDTKFQFVEFQPATP